MDQVCINQPSCGTDGGAWIKFVLISQVVEQMVEHGSSLYKSAKLWNRWWSMDQVCINQPSCGTDGGAWIKFV